VPFTPSHAVVALPFVRTPLVPAAIAIGAMTPDLPLFLRSTPLTYQATHTNVLLSTVIALGLLALWYAVLRPAVRELSPDALARRLPRSRLVVALLVAVSLLVGVLSHIAWDAFTHEDRWGLRLIPALTDQWGPLPGYKWLQHGSSIVALVILAVYGARWLSRRAPVASGARVLPRGVRRAWWASLPIALVVAWLIGLAVYGPLTASWTAQHLAYRVLPPACAVWGVLTLVLCLAIVLVRRRGARA
jgi:uncharacterized membrane protein YidH (DUF202 family)